ncbi:hypothetical protein GIB67_014390 [Kingdonia uniflora]|uniref:Uncharacterized protein n=1 Tax=Kingdonia uniflora TaxID=39325 RepID=A0A7J7LZ38_9MAGN|nr:hypothetical protein GIB67_014390 [Kingdonia uniflora]
MFYHLSKEARIQVLVKNSKNLSPICIFAHGLQVVGSHFDRKTHKIQLRKLVF